MDRHQHETAQSCYRGVQLHLTQSPTGTIVWGLSVKRADAHWGDWERVHGASLHGEPIITSTREAARVAARILDAYVGSLSGPR